MTRAEFDHLLHVLETLDKVDDFRLKNFLDLARERLTVLWAEALRAERNAEDTSLLFGDSDDH